MKPMKLVYIAHPLRNDINGNMSRIEDIMTHLSESAQQAHEPKHNYFSPLHAFSFVEPSGPQEWVMDRCLDMVSRCDELWLYGRWHESVGCRHEFIHAMRLGKIIKFKDADAQESIEKVADQLLPGWWKILGVEDAI